jgi:hypothetical protein
MDGAYWTANAMFSGQTRSVGKFTNRQEAQDAYDKEVMLAERDADARSNGGPGIHRPRAQRRSAHPQGTKRKRGAAFEIPAARCFYQLANIRSEIGGSDDNGLQKDKKNQKWSAHGAFLRVPNSKGELKVQPSLRPPSVPPLPLQTTTRPTTTVAVGVNGSWAASV